MVNLHVLRVNGSLCFEISVVGVTLSQSSMTIHRLIRKNTGAFVSNGIMDVKSPGTLTFFWKIQKNAPCASDY